MKTIHIQAKEFFELLKLKDQSMWDIFAQMIDGEEKFLFGYRLPATLEKMQEDKKLFAEKYAEKIMLN